MVLQETTKGEVEKLTRPFRLNLAFTSSPSTTMKLSATITTLLSLWAIVAISHPLEFHQNTPDSSHLRTIYQFPNETWVENLAIRSNGKILVTLVSVPEVWEIDPFATPATAELVYRFSDAISLSGIAEYAPDVFAVNVGNFSDKTFTSQMGSWRVWSLDMSSHWHGGWDEKHHGSWNHGFNFGVYVEKISDIPEALFLNGMTTLPASPRTLLMADSGAGLIYRLDTKTGAYSIVIDNPALKPNETAFLKLGVNGIHFRPGEDNYVYFTNSLMSPAFSRIPIDPLTGMQTGPDESIVESLTKSGGAPDDFTFDSTGKATYIADGALNGLLRVGLPSGETEVVVGGTEQSKVVGQTACQFGRTREDVEKGTLYITTTGGIVVPPPQGIVGGSVFALDTAQL